MNPPPHLHLPNPIRDQSEYIIPPSQTEKNWAEKKSQIDYKFIRTC